MTDEAQAVAPEKLFESDTFKAILETTVKNAVAAALTGSTVATIDSVKTYLDENLPDLVAAAMPETPEAKAARERQERADQAAADAEAREAADAVKAEEVAEATRVAAEERADTVKAAQKAFVADEKLAKKQPRDQVDYAKLIDAEGDYVIVADNGDTYCPDWRFAIDASRHLDIQKDRGVSVTVAMDVAELPERFSFARLTLRRADVKDSPILRSEIVQPFWVGEGRKADFPANSLLFRVIA